MVLGYYQHLGVQMRGEMQGYDKKMRMKVCHDHSPTEDLTQRIERAGYLMDLLVDGPGLVLRSVPRNPPLAAASG
jgi:hypothetical protein